MKTILIIAISIFIPTAGLFSQESIDAVLGEIEKNNTLLSSLSKKVEAEKLSNKTGIYIENPEIEFNYLWNNPSEYGNRTDISLTQSFDFPTSYAYRNQISDIQNEQLELEYQKQRKVLLLEARMLCYELIYTNALKLEYTKRLGQAENIANLYKVKFENGETNILEYNKAQLNYLNLNTEMEQIEIARNSLLSELSRLNGGTFINFHESEFQVPSIPIEFETWYVQAEQSNPLLSWLKLEVERNQREEKLNKAMSLPKIQAGYMSERVVGQKFQGLTLGMSIPLWENKNTVKYARANTVYIEEQLYDNKIQFYTQLKAAHSRAISMLANTNDFRSQFLKFDNSELLGKALEQGEMSMIEYILELSFYFEGVNKLLKMETELNKTLAGLNQYL